MVADFWMAIEEAERTRLICTFGLHGLQTNFDREQEKFSTERGSEDELQALWEQAELARAEIKNERPALNAQTLVAMNSALDALVEELAPAIRDMPFQALLKRAEEQVPEAVDHLTPERRNLLLEALQEALGVPRLEWMRGSGTARYEARLEQVTLGAPDDRPIPDDLDQALAELGAIRDVLIHRAGRVDERALDQAPSLRYEDGELIRLSDADYRTYSAAVRCYGAEIEFRSLRRWIGAMDEDGPQLDNWREYRTINA